MKRFASLLLALCLALGLCSCGWSGRPSSQSTGPQPTAVPPASAPGTVPGQTAPGSAGSHSAQPSAPPAAPSAPSHAAAANAAAPAEGPWSLVLVNADHPLPPDFAVKTRPIPGFQGRRLDARAADALIALLDAAQEAGTPLYLVSAYRSTARQEALFLRKTNFFRAQGLPLPQAQEQAARIVARPGTSEHNLGLAVDLVSADWYQTHSDLTDDFAQTPAAAWLGQHAAEFGFILRYPPHKEEVTGVAYEPWHFRYVGPTAAKALAGSGLCLEEYLACTP